MALTLNGTTGIQNVLGSAAAPAESNTTSSNTGMYFPTSTTLGFSTAGTNAVYIDASQNVGIGTTSPGGKFNVSGTSVFGAISSVYALQIGYNNTRAVAGQTYYIGATDSATPDLVFSDAGAVARLRVSSTGVVTMSAYGAGTATFSAAGVISSVSDETWKIKDGIPVNPDFMLKKLEPGYWYYNDEKKEIFGVDRQLGFYAQNVNAAIGPEAAPTPEEGRPWGYYDRSVLAVTVMSLQKALATIESLTARIEALEAR